MTAIYKDREIGIFTINTRSSDPADYWAAFAGLVKLTDGYDFDGMLCFSANETLVDPWLAAHYLILNSRRLIPIVATNPVYLHPFAAAKMVSSFAYMHGRKTILNLITGASGRDREVLSDPIDHDDRYTRLGEYARIMKSLLTDPKMMDFEGRYYKLSSAVLSPTPPPALHPGFLVAGHSDAAIRTAGLVDAVHLRMLGPKLEEDLPEAAGGLGIHLGIIAREDEDAAWAAAKAHYPHDPEVEGILEYMMEGSDSVWKRRLYEKTLERGDARPEYWLEPFGQLRADCPYLVGAHERLAEILAAHIEKGADWIILDLPNEQEEFENTAKTLRLAYELLGIEAKKGEAPATA